jgi:hypothetical protein
MLREQEESDADLARRLHEEEQSKRHVSHIVCLIGFYVTLTQYRSYNTVTALLVEEDLRCPSMH